MMPCSEQPASHARSRRRLHALVGHSLLALAMVALPQVVGPASASNPERWRLHPAVGLLDTLTLRIHWFASSKELREAAKGSAHAISEIGLHGFSVLKRNAKTGEYVCDVYVVNMTGALVDNDRTMTFGHEVLHCFGLKHE